eukprot:jgi/Ulvmu1/10421/UM062_0017.1
MTPRDPTVLTRNIIRLGAAAAAFVCRSCLADIRPVQGVQFFAAAAPGTFQDAIWAGVRHIVLTDHMDMTASPTAPDMDHEVEALNAAIGRVQFTTRSIVAFLPLHQWPPPLQSS